MYIHWQVYVLMNEYHMLLFKNRKWLSWIKKIIIWDLNYSKISVLNHWTITVITIHFSGPQQLKTHTGTVYVLTTLALLLFYFPSSKRTVPAPQRRQGTVYRRRVERRRSRQPETKIDRGHISTRMNLRTWVVDSSQDMQVWRTWTCIPMVTGRSPIIGWNIWELANGTNTNI